jgi:hypothetical protein
MIYFLVNNSYHLYDTHIHLCSLKYSAISVGLIEIPHSLDKPDRTGFDVVYTFRPFHYKSLIRSWISALSALAQVRRKIVPTNGDVLFLYTEYEPFNQLIAAQFKKRGARVYLIEDGGFATYVPFRSESSEPLTIRERLRELVVRVCPGVSHLRFHKMNGLVLPWMDEKLLDGVCVYRRVFFERKVTPILIKRSTTVSFTGDKDTVIFLNECIYDHYQTAENYLLGLHSITKGLCDGFAVVYFKFHPRESEKWRRTIQQEVLDKYTRVIVIKEDVVIERIVQQYRPAVVASYFSAALLNLHDLGLEPMYLYHLIDDLRDQPVFRIVTSILEDWGYNFVTNFSCVRSGYISGIPANNRADGAQSIQELVENGSDICEADFSSF